MDESFHKPQVEFVLREPRRSRSLSRSPSRTRTAHARQQSIRQKTVAIQFEREQQNQSLSQQNQQKQQPEISVVPLKQKVSSSASDNPYLNSSHISINPLMQSGTGNPATTDQFDQDFRLSINQSVTQKSTKNMRSIIQRNKSYLPNGHHSQSDASISCMAGIIGIVMGLIAFAFGLAALVLVLRLQSTVANSQSTTSGNSSTSGSSSNGTVGSGTLSSDACTNYTTITDATRSITAPGYALGCDNTAPFANRSIAVWIRFTGSGGTTLPLTPPNMNQCGSTGTGWFYGTMPSSTGTTTIGAGCINWYNSLCQYSTLVTVANCGSYYIYLLYPPPVCMARYCTV